MLRRDFLKGLLALPLAPLVPQAKVGEAETAKPITDKEEFLPVALRQYGGTWTQTGRTSADGEISSITRYVLDGGIGMGVDRFNLPAPGPLDHMHMIEIEGA